MSSWMELLYIKMAWLNVGRRKSRSILIALMIAVSLVGLLLMEGIYEGMMVQITQTTIRTGSGTVSIQHKDFRSDQDIRHMIHEPQTLRTILDQTDGISSYAMRLNQQGLIANAGYSQSVSVSGIDLQEASRQSELGTYMISGEYSFLDNGRGAILGYRLAEKIKTSVGKKVIVTLQDIDNEVVSMALTVNGIIKTNNMAIDSNGLLMERSKMQDLLGVKGVTQIAIMLENNDADEAMKQQLSKRIDNNDLAVYSYKDLFPTLHESEVMMENYNKISSAFIFIVASLGIFGVVLVSVLERVREFGIMMAVGTPFFGIIRLVIYESLFITMSGYIAGALIGGSLLWYFSHYGLDLSGFSDAFAIFGMDANIYALVKQEYFTSALISVVLATLAAVLLPIRTLRQHNPIQSINKQVT